MALIGDILAVSLRPEARPASGGERRGAPREVLGRPVTVHPWRDGALGLPMTMLLHDLSTTGLGVIDHRRANLGDQFLLPHLRDGRREGWFVCEVVRCQQTGDSLYSMGLRFVSQLPNDAVETQTLCANTSDE